MSGHSKWSTIKRKKGAADAKRGALFGKLSRAITVAAREGGGDPEMNPALSLAVQKAKDANMPNDNIDRAIAKGTGAGSEGENFERITYEGYAPGGVAVLVDVLTDNRNRTASDVRYIFTKNGGKLGTSGSVAYLFDRKGVIMVPAEGLDEDDLMLAALDAGAEDVVREGDHFRVTTEATDFMAVREGLEEAGITYEDANLSMEPQNTVDLDASTARQTLRLIDALEENDDVQEVFANFDVSEEVMAEVAG
ncbi:TIGR01033: DNA-binding regulatory protein, YebC/PmpR family [Rubrobacter radiotolerans]|uniref:Probable transcriptional regulatory protein RradSPS_1294 n=1 Tax=Rubrobacter radiotolerans TaxID=42256 RepID=A0A023X2B8_RUBRA|nr:YebC/PmpR family DNA-binding transcriptional regulator [Rubrobacter radiotolerans]AHY46577.1 TIGR01033: DNA-binding regulatory protein, YebC/PmpR family [Rubrobacter radiotolerans]MDX5893984.1 YebC/PmpR family DNA-binding transcriptional regulator [Rubrobacter radiotolerans]SMC04908.1 DNA-binding regulatory protein, YebC/PmpR family [Rubrobacter radiotolerans DSM 5868]